MSKRRSSRWSSRITRSRVSRMEGLEARTLLAAEVLRLSPSYLEGLGVVESAFIERVRNADVSQDDRVSTRDVLYSVGNREQFDATLSVIEDWQSEISKSLAQRLVSLDPVRWASLGIASGDPPLEGGEGGMPPPGGSGGGGGGTWHGSNPGGGHPIVIWGTPYEFDIDAAIVKVVNKIHTPTGVLGESVEDSEGAWVLVNNDNDDFNQVDTAGNPVQGEIGVDELQTSPVVNEDDLLPVVLRANPSYPDGYFWLTYSSGIRVYEDAQKTTLATGFYSSGADTQLFVEGLSTMVANEINYDHLQINLVDGFYSYVCDNVDSIRINRFMINGPTSVPIGSRYIYNAIGVDPTISNWVNPTQGTKTPVQWEHAASFNDWQEIMWNTTEEGGKQSMEKAVYELPNEYQWGFDVARVQVSVIAVNSKIALEGHVEQMSGADDRAITTVPVYSPSVDGSQRPMMAVAEINIEGPKKNNRVRGSNEIEVGFVQNLTLVRQHADYEGAITWDVAMPHNVPILDADSAFEVWYDDGNNTGDYFHSGVIDQSDGTDHDGYEAYSVPTGSGQSAAQNYWIDMGDGPKAFMAPSWRDQVLVDNWLDEVYGKWHFSLYVAARTTQEVITSHTNTPAQFLNVTSITDPQSAITPDASLRLSPLNSSYLYFQQAYANWDFVFDGDIDGYAWNSSPASGLVGDSQFTSMASNPGTLVPSTMGLPVNHYLAQIAYDGFSGWDRRTP